MRPRPLLLPCALVSLVALMIAAAPTAALAGSQVLKVPGDAPDVQGAIELAADGDTVLVGPGTWLGAIDFLGKAVTVASARGPDHTFLSADGRSSVVTFASGEGQDSVLSGFTLLDGNGSLTPAGVAGGGVLVQDAWPRLVDCTINANQGGDLGGAVAVQASDDQAAAHTGITIEGCRLFGNGAFLGGGVWADGGTVIVHSTSISASHGGALVGSAHFELDDVSLHGNLGFRGGGLVLLAPGGGIDGVTRTGSAAVRRTRMTTNTALVQGGGAVALYGGPDEAPALTLEDVFICNNLANGTGGGISAELGPSGTGGLRVERAVLCHNAAVGAGGAIFVSGLTAEGALLLDRMTVADNISVQGAAALGLEATGAVVHDTIVWRHDPGAVSAPQATFSYSCVEGGVLPGAGNLSSDPQFLAPAAGDYSLLTGSPCLDAGDPDGRPDLDGSPPDMGAPLAEAGVR